MIGEKFFNNISSLTNSELNACVRLSKNLLLNKRKEISTSLELFKASKDNFFKLLGNEEELFSKIFKKEKLNKKKLRDHFHYCNIFFEDFVIFNSSQTNKELRLKILEEYYVDRNISKEALKINSKLEKIVQARNIGFNSYLQLYDLNTKRFDLEVNNFSNDTFGHIQNAVDNLDKFYFLAKLHWNQELLSNSRMNKIEYKTVFIDEIKDYIAHDDELSNKLLFKIYSITSDLYSGDFSFEVYKELKVLVFDNLNDFAFNTKKTLLTDLINYLAYLYNESGENLLLEELFLIEKKQIEEKTFLVNNLYPEPNFSQLIRVALFLKEYDWVIQFLDENEKYVLNKNLVNFTRAEVYYNIESFDKALDILNVLESDRVSVNFEMKFLKAKILYDQNNLDLLENFLNSFEIFVRRQKEISVELKENNTRSILYFKRLYKNKLKKNRLQKLKEDIDKDKSVFNRNWLLNRVVSLLKSF